MIYSEDWFRLRTGRSEFMLVGQECTEGGHACTGLWSEIFNPKAIFKIRLCLRYGGDVSFWHWNQMLDKDMRKKYQFTAITISIAILFWFSDSLIHYFVYGEQAFEVYPSDLNELWMRFVIVVLIVAFGVFVDYRTGLDNVSVYQAMLSATNHILRNYLQKMIVFREEAANSKDFNKDVLKLYDQMIDETLAQIRNLENIQEPNKTNIEERYLPK